MSNLQIIDQVEGTGAAIQKGQIAQVHYTGWLNNANGQQFDSSADRGPFEFQVGVGQVIKGWDEGLLGNEDKGPMKVGGTRLLTIPSDMGYGIRGAGDAIPPNATLFFKVELLGVK